MKNFLILTLLLIGVININAQTASAKDFSAWKTIVYNQNLTKANCTTFFVISKKDYYLNVYGATGRDTTLIARFPVCVGRNPANKTRVGDHATPESGSSVPFTISEINDAHTWTHDFKDGYGSKLAYGAWFLRLKLNGALAGNRSIGIHGCTGNEGTIPGSKAELRKGHAQGNDSEGCIRLNDADIITLKEKYARVGTKVYILSSSTTRPSWERKLMSKK